MNKRFLFAFLPLLALSLASCEDTDQLYYANQFLGDNFIATQYDVWDAGLKEATISASYTMKNYGSTSDTSLRYFAGSGNYASPSDCSGFGQAKSWHPEYFGNLVWSPDIEPATPIGEYYDQSRLIGTAYGQTKKLSSINGGFRRGYLSKLYDGQVRCNAWGSLSYVGLDKGGYGTLFPSELRSSEYFAFSCRGGADTPDSGVGRVVTMDINVTFYKIGASGNYVGTSLLLDDVKVQANRSAELTSLVGFPFSEIPSFDVNGIVGMSVTYSLVDDPYGSTSDDFHDGSQYHLGLLLLEVFLPDSSWY